MVRLRRFEFAVDLEYATCLLMAIKSEMESNRRVETARSDLMRVLP